MSHGIICLIVASLILAFFSAKGFSSSGGEDGETREEKKNRALRYLSEENPGGLFLGGTLFSISQLRDMEVISWDNSTYCSEEGEFFCYGIIFNTPKGLQYTSIFSGGDYFIEKPKEFWCRLEQAVQQRKVSQEDYQRCLSLKKHKIVEESQ